MMQPLNLRLRPGVRPKAPQIGRGPDGKSFGREPASAQPSKLALFLELENRAARAECSLASGGRPCQPTGSTEAV
jgi:hypothetical protein